MINNLFKVALRQAQRNPFYFFLNLVGVTIGMACCLIIFQYVQYELSFDQFHSRKDRIYRVNYDMTMAGSQTISPSVPVFVGPHLKSKFPEIESATRFLDGFSDRTIRFGEKTFDERGFAWADSNFFDVFDFKVVRGDLRHALARPGTLVISESVSKKYFGEDDAIGKVMTVNNTQEFEVTAVMADVGANSSFRFDFLTSLYSIKDLDESMQWGNPNYATFLLLEPGADMPGLAEKIDQWVIAGANNATDNSLHLPLEPLEEIHFNTSIFNFGGRLAITDFKTLLVFSTVGVLILLIAVINYVNLATSRAAGRAKEVGLRKTVGANFAQLFIQFLCESFFMVLPAVLFSILAVTLTLPIVNSILNKQIPFNPFDPQFILIAASAWILLSFLAGFYPAIVLTRFKPIAALKGKFVQGSSGWSLRKALVVVQFAITTMMITGTFILLGQLDFMQSKKLGLDKDHVFVLKGNSELSKGIRSFAEELRGIPGVRDVSLTWRSPFRTVIGNGLALTANPGDETQWASVGAVGADEHYLQTLGISLLAGRNFDPAKYAGAVVENELIVNESFLEEFSIPMSEAIGMKVTLGIVAQNGPATIVGVMNDFHTASLQTKVRPVVLFNDPSWVRSLLVRAEGEKMQEVLDAVGRKWKASLPNWPFNYSFLDQEYNALYKAETQMGSLITGFSLIAIAIASFGLLGLSSYTAVQRAREIGIRKVMGATTESIVLLLSNGYLRLLAIACLIAIPVSYYLMDQWLQGFAYHITPGPLYFGGAVVTVIFIAWLTVGYHSVKASIANPASTLKYE